jgi:hypothetical protein
MQDNTLILCHKRIVRFFLEHEDNKCRGAFTKRTVDDKVQKHKRNWNIKTQERIRKKLL